MTKLSLSKNGHLIESCLDRGAAIEDLVTTVLLHIEDAKKLAHARAGSPITAAVASADSQHRSTPDPVMVDTISKFVVIDVSEEGLLVLTASIAPGNRNQLGIAP